MDTQGSGASDAYMPAVDVEVKDQVATVRLLTRSQWMRKTGITPETFATLERAWEIHSDLAAALQQLRDDADVRVVVITGAEDGLFLSATEPGRSPEETAKTSALGRSEQLYDVFMGVVRHTQVAIEMEKPLIARVNGDAIGVGQSIMFQCDLIVAREDAIIVDPHMGPEEWPPELGPDLAPYIAAYPSSSTDTIIGVPPGDGGAALVPLYLSPAKAKEYLMLGKPYTAKDMAQLGVINYAVPMSQLDTIVDDLVRRLLRRSPESLALTKRAVNRRMAQQVNLTMDAAAGYQWLSILRAKSRVKTT